MRKVLCSTGALLGRPNGRNHRLLREYVPQLACDGFEFMLYDTWYPSIDTVIADVKALGLNIPVMHCEKRIGEMLAVRDYKAAEEAFRLNCRVAYEIGADKMVLHLWNGVISDSDIDANFGGYIMLRDMAHGYGLTLTVENVVCSHSSPMSHIDRLARETDAVFTFDTKMAAFHSELDAIFSPERADLWQDGRIKHLHINDYGGGYMDWQSLRTLHLGEGHIDFGDFFAKLRSCNYRGDFTIESTAFLPDGTVNLDKLNRDFEMLRKYL